MRYVLEIMIEQSSGPHPTTEQLVEAANAAGRNLPGIVSEWAIRGMSPLFVPERTGRSE